MASSAERTRVRGMCRTCMVSCGVFMELENGRIVSLIGDKDDPASHGYSCDRGRDIVPQLYGPNRLLRPLRRTEAGDLEETSRSTWRRRPLNSMGRDQARLVRERPHHPAYMHPDDMAALGLEPGALVAITSRRATVHAVVTDAADLRRGVVSMSHGYGLDLERLGPGADPGEPQPWSMGNHTGALASADLDYAEPHTGLPRMSSIPVHVTAAARS